MGLKYRHLEGRPHAVVDVTMLVEGVLFGSSGALFYPAAEIERSVAAWNGKPIVVMHPNLYSTPVAAGMPEIFDRQRVGTVFNAYFAKRKLHAEAWIDIERANAVDHRVMTALRSNRTLEVSTGLFTDNDMGSGIFNGLNYAGVARKYQPDHLAILPDLVGACSIAMGCGLLRTNSEQSYVAEPGFTSA
jgi:hypothetical protein